jgi:hypothetical protein
MNFGGNEFASVILYQEKRYREAGESVVYCVYVFYL